MLPETMTKASTPTGADELHQTLDHWAQSASHAARFVREGFRQGVQNAYDALSSGALTLSARRMPPRPVLWRRLRATGHRAAQTLNQEHP